MEGMLLSTSRIRRTMGFRSLQNSLIAAQNSSSKMMAFAAADLSRLAGFLAHLSHSPETTVCRAALLHFSRRAQLM